MVNAVEVGRTVLRMPPEARGLMATAGLDKGIENKLLLADTIRWAIGRRHFG